MNPPAYDLAQLLHQRGIGVWETNLFVGTEPPEPDDSITLYDTPGGLEPDTDEGDIFRPMINVRTRSANYLSAYAKQEEIRKLFLATPLFILSSRFSAVIPTSDIASLGQDENNRYTFFLNYRCMRSAA